MGHESMSRGNIGPIGRFSPPAGGVFLGSSMYNPCTHEGLYYAHIAPCPSRCMGTGSIGGSSYGVCAGTRGNEVILFPQGVSPLPFGGLCLRAAFSVDIKHFTTIAHFG